MASDLTPKQNERLRIAMQKARDEHFDANTTKLAKAIGRSQPSISEILNGGGASFKTAQLFAQKVAKVHVSELIGEPETTEERVVQTVEENYRYDSLREVVERGDDGRPWPPGAIAQAKSKAFKADEDPGERYWWEQLRRFKSSLELADLPIPKIRPEGDPLDDID